MLKILKTISALIICINFSCAYGKDQDKIHIYNWSNYIPLSVIQEFKNNTGISVVYDVYDSEEMLDAKLISGNTGYDLVFPANGLFLPNQIKMSLYKELNVSKLHNYKNLDPKILQILDESDPGNKHTIPFMWTTTGLGYNVKQIRSIDPSAPLNSLKLVFDPKYAEKFAKCGIAWANFPAEIIGLAMLYNGDDPNNINDATLQRANATLKAVRKYVKYILPSDVYSDNLANGSVCLVLGWVGEIAQSKEKLKAAKIIDNIEYVQPVEGSIMSIDSMAIPSTSHHDHIYQFIDFLLEPKVSSEIAKQTHHYSASKNSPTSSLNTMHVLKPQQIKILRQRNKIWNNILTEAGG